MTIIAVMREAEDAFLIGAESGQTEPHIGLITTYPNKLQRHSTAPLAWGAAGNPTIGIHQLGARLTQYQWPPPTWEKFQDEVCEHLSKLNGRQRELNKLAGIEPKSELLAEVMIVGWLDSPCVFAVDDEGAISILDGAEFHAIGSGGVHTRLIHIAYKAVNFSASPLDIFGHILNLATHAAVQCSPPVHVWRVKVDGIQEVS